MAKKSSPLFRRAWNLLRLGIFMEKNSGQLEKKTLFFKRRIRNKKLLKHYSYTFVAEYQFSPERSPLFNNFKGTQKMKKCRRLCSVLLLPCSGNPPMEEEKEEPEIPAILMAAGDVESSDSGEEDNAVDRRAEKFIARFYEEMRIQRQESESLFMEMLNRGCS